MCQKENVIRSYTASTISLRDSSKRKRNDEVVDEDGASAPSEALVPRSAVSSTSTLQRRSKEYVAVRRGLFVRKCIFNSWEEAAEHLDGSACDIEYRISCGSIEEAAAFAFQEELEDENEQNDLPSVSSIDIFADDIMLMIFSFVCGENHSGGGTFADTSHLHPPLPGFGASSKLCRKMCIEYVQHVLIIVKFQRTKSSA